MKSRLGKSTGASSLTIQKLQYYLAEKFTINPVTECWDWIGYITKEGYGTFQIKYTTQFAHRVFYELTVGKIPDGLVVDHLCNNRACVNPRHLKPSTIVENNRHRHFGRGCRVCNCRHVV